MLNKLSWFRTSWGRVTLSLGVYFLLLRNMLADESYTGVLRCTHPRANDIAASLILMLPIVSLIFLCQCPRSKERGIAAVFLLLLALISAPFGVLTAIASYDALTAGADSTVNDPVPISTLRVGNRTVKAYRKYEWMGHDQIYIEQERNLGLGLTWITVLYKDIDTKRDVEMTLVDGKVRCTGVFGGPVTLPLR